MLMCRSSSGLPCSATNRRPRITRSRGRSRHRPDPPNNPQHDVLRATPPAARPSSKSANVFGFPCGRHCVASTCSLRRPNPKRQRSQPRALRCASPRRQSSFPASSAPAPAQLHHDALPRRLPTSYKCHAKIAQFSAASDLLRRNRILDDQPIRRGRHIVIHRCYRPVRRRTFRPASRSPSNACATSPRESGADRLYSNTAHSPLGHDVRFPNLLE